MRKKNRHRCRPMDTDEEGLNQITAKSSEFRRSLHSLQFICVHRSASVAICISRSRGVKPRHPGNGSTGVSPVALDGMAAKRTIQTCSFQQQFQHERRSFTVALKLRSRRRGRNGPRCNWATMLIRAASMSFTPMVRFYTSAGQPPADLVRSESGCEGTAKKKRQAIVPYFKPSVLVPHRFVHTCWIWTTLT